MVLIVKMDGLDPLRVYLVVDVHRPPESHLGSGLGVPLSWDEYVSLGGTVESMSSWRSTIQLRGP